MKRGESSHVYSQISEYYLYHLFVSLLCSQQSTHSVRATLQVVEHSQMLMGTRPCQDAHRDLQTSRQSVNVYPYIKMIYNMILPVV